MITYDYKTKVYYKDIDQMGLVYYTRYLEYFEAARTEMLKSIGLIVTDIENEGFFLPVVSAHCDYKKGAQFEDEIIIRTSINEKPKARLKIDYEVLKDDAVLATGYTVHGFTDHEGNAKRPPKSFQKVMEKYF
ncbi:MAG TPA: thioesterase family protein [Candidatus Marinimicrobia bacterium]|nr:thioesterase family protein [Candidatus Neomarinimicrobiota bacterium]MDP7217610.1 thioesterase family protein [Candidatus Neomarinimicrobiota bacterium]HBN45518.1 acyl-CoA thioesterase [Candidatus Neomarinimicrobiota bacterium]HJL75277.1 thioesterase family protein [Candidatus Neomarinimicrobiota bacterium]HJM70416.1 thioesterase family protein [Candidatus Neomarinimicrobiota bacterium]